MHRAAIATVLLLGLPWGGACHFDGSAEPAGPLDLAVDHHALDQRPSDSPPGADLVLHDVALVCDPSACPLGCHATEPRCNRLRPANFDVSEQELQQATAKVSLVGASEITLNTDTGAIMQDGSELRPEGVGAHKDIVYQRLAGIGVFVLRGLGLAPDATVRVQGVRALALYALDDVTIAGKLLAVANQAAPGPGGRGGGAKDGQPGVACGGGEGQGGLVGTSWVESGGGGGGHGAAGGSGGTLNTFAALPGPGGQPVGSAELVPLQGGCGGGAGGGPQVGVGGYGGGGGGAIQISAGRRIVVTGTILVSGAGGGGGTHTGTSDPPQYGAAGGGGGAGGAILLQATEIELGGMLAANGGGGGGGACGGGACASPGNGQPGEDGRPDLARAVGGAADKYGIGSAGGAGGAGSTPAGLTAASNVYNGGGGGGAAGRVHFDTPKLKAQPDSSSPGATHGTALTTQ